MKEIKSIIAEYHKRSSEGVDMAIATVVHVEDSSYRRSGARMLITADGQWTGGISGGCLEGDILKKAQHAIFRKQPVVVRYDTREGDESQIGVGLGCNGLIDVLISPFVEGDNTISILESLFYTRESSILYTFLSPDEPTGGFGKTIKYTSDAEMLKLFDAELANLLIFSSQLVIQSRESRTVDLVTANGSHKIFIEYLPPPIHIYIFGKNYDVLPLASIAKHIGWTVTIVANPLKVSKALYEEADFVISQNSLEGDFDYYSVALLMSHDYKTDKTNLLELQQYNLKYIGLLGPKKRAEKMFLELQNEGIPFSQENVFAPIGLDTGATTPEEIAISMIAEIRAVYSSREGGFLKNRKSPINKG